MKKNIFLCLLLVGNLIYTHKSQAQSYEATRPPNGYSTWEPLVLESPDKQYRLKGYDYVYPSGFYPRSPKVAIKLYKVDRNKRICTLRFRTCDRVKRMAFSADEKYLLLSLDGCFEGKNYFKINFANFKRGWKRLCVMEDTN